MSGRSPEIHRPGRSRRLLVSLVALLTLLGPACAAQSPAPPSWRVPRHELERRQFGAWANLSLREGGLSGELLAVDGQWVYVAAAPSVVQVSVTCVNEMRLAVYDNHDSTVALVGTMGTLSTLSHGLFLFLTAPVWITVTGVNSYSNSKAGHLSFGTRYQVPLQAGAHYARFPAGMPPGFLERAPGRQALDARCQASAPLPAIGTP